VVAYELRLAVVAYELRLAVVAYELRLAVVAYEFKLDTVAYALSEGGIYVKTPIELSYVNAPVPAGAEVLTLRLDKAIPVPPAPVKSGAAIHLACDVLYFKTCPSDAPVTLTSVNELKLLLAALMMPLLIVIVVPSTLTAPSCVVVAVAIPIVPLVFVIPLVPTAGIITPPNANVVAAVNVNDVLLPLPLPP
jgi:hypothetical protein